jgi:hypothetical protein
MPLWLFEDLAIDHHETDHEGQPGAMVVISIVPAMAKA